MTLFLCFPRVQDLRLWAGYVGSQASSSSGKTRGAGNVDAFWFSSLEYFLDVVELGVPRGVVAAILWARFGFL